MLGIANRAGETVNERFETDIEELKEEIASMRTADWFLLVLATMENLTDLMQMAFAVSIR